MRGAQLALDDLGRRDIQITLTEIKFNLVDASTSGFVFAAYEAVHKHVTGATRHECATAELLAEIEFRTKRHGCRRDA